MRLRRLYNYGMPILLIVGFGGALACDGGPATPKASCQTGSRKVEHSGNKTKLYECHNEEWVRVACFNGTTKSEVKKGRTVHYRCESNTWVRQ